MGHRLATIFLLLGSALAFGQTFSVLDETTGRTFFDTLDGTTEFRFSVRLSSGSTLSGVVPELVPPACATQSGQPIFNTTFMGQVGGSTTSLAIPTWSNNQTKELIFRVHLFDNNVVCDGPLACGGDFDFQLRFTHSNNSNPITASDPSNFLDITGPPTDGFQIVATVSETLPSACKPYIGNNESILVDYNGFPKSLLNDPEVKVFLGVDWNLNINNVSPPFSFAVGLKNFFYPTGSAINDVVLLKGTSDTEPQLPLIPEDTVILDPNNFPLTQGPLGGNGPLNGTNDCTVSTWNFFDITNISPLSGGAPPIIDHLEAIDTNRLTMSASLTQLNFRKAGIYLLKPSGCKEGVAFGAPPTQIQFEEYHLLPGGIADVALSLPASWTTAGGTQLNSNYTIQWFYRNQGALTRATLPGGGSTNARNLSTMLSVPFSDPSDFIIEARISLVGSNAIVSVQSPGHDLTYSGLSNRSFENAEFGDSGFPSPDNYLDAGEMLVQELNVQNIGSFANNVTVTIGRNSPKDSDFAFGSRQAADVFFGAGLAGNEQVFQTNLNNNASFDIELLYELLQSKAACDDIDLFFEVSYQNQGMETSFRQEFSTPSNCEFVVNEFPLNGFWIDAENFGSPPCTSSNCASAVTSSPTDGWGFANPQWIGSTDTRAFYYTLTSPPAGYPVGQEPGIEMRHQATFRLLDAGGIVEYRTRNTGGAWSNWNDLIEPIETQNAMEIYNNRVFSTIFPGIDNVLGSRRVFMDMTSEQSFDLPVSGIFSGDEVQFRFLYHLVNDASPSPGLWQISEFIYKSKLPQFDDLFNLGSNLNFNTCSPVIQLNPQPSGSYTFFWYTDLGDLADDSPAFVSTNGEWEFPIPASSTEYYVKVRLDTPGTTRIYKLTIDATTTVPPFESVVEAWNTPGSLGNTDIDSNGVVDVIDVILQIILDDCK